MDKIKVIMNSFKIFADSINIRGNNLAIQQDSGRIVYHIVVIIASLCFIF